MLMVLMRCCADLMSTPSPAALSSGAFVRSALQFPCTFLCHVERATRPHNVGCSKCQGPEIVSVFWRLLIPQEQDQGDEQ